MIIKCKVCGGDIQFNPGDTCGQCDHCGCATTIPKTEDEQRLNRFDRANHFRRLCEFDKAINAYERILEEDNTDAEAHWGVALSRYGIEYVEDPATKKRVPTCHRVQLESILVDGDYLDALKYAPDDESRQIYESQAKEIAEIQKDILAISSSEEPYDVFISYKDTDENGQRTRDSALAQEVYYGLTGQGYKVFYSRITLEDKLGQHYEPYIFAALNSARVMIVIGTKPEYFNAVWVKNEWSRYLRLMKSDRKRLMIPCYRDMDPYDLPEELGNLQSQDMSKIGFLQDLIRGIRKVLDINSDTAKGASGKQTVLTSENIGSILDRAFLCIEDGDFAKADDFLEMVLNQQPRNSRAYIGKLLVERKAKSIEKLKKGTIPLDQSVAYQRAMRFAENEKKQELESINQEIIKKSAFDEKAQIRDKALQDLGNALTVGECRRIRKDLETIEYFEGVKNAIAACDKRIETIYKANYDQAMKMLSEKAYVKARDAFEYIGEYKDSWDKALECMYLYAKDEMEKGHYSEAATLYKKLGDYKDSVANELRCRKKAVLKGQKIEESSKKDNASAEPAANPNQKELLQMRAMKIKEKYEKRKKGIIILLSTLVPIALILLTFLYIIPISVYNSAVNDMKYGLYEKARSAFAGLNGFKDSEEKATECIYLNAQRQLKDGHYEDAMKLFAELRDYMDSEEKIQECIRSAHNAMIAEFGKKGNAVYFGNYEQNNVFDTKESIAWYVLDVQDGKCLLLCKDGIEKKQYHADEKDITWASSNLRAWLNGSFIKEAFTDEEAQTIILTNVDNSQSQGYKDWNTNGGTQTNDKVFLLSYKEANQYLGVSAENKENKIARCAPTEYAVSQGAQRGGQRTADGDAAGWWWLRSPGKNQKSAAYVQDTGMLEDTPVTDNGCVIRPAIWLNLEADYFYPIPKNYHP